jgi:hypothetical protein
VVVILFIIVVGASCSSSSEPDRESPNDLISSSGTVELSPNTIQGTIRFANTNPEILALLETEGIDLLMARAKSASGYSASTNHLAPSDNLGGTYQLWAEASGGTGSVTYSVEAIAWVNRGARSGKKGLGTGQYYFRPREVTLRPASVQPNGVTQDLVEKVGVVRIRFGTDITCTTPVSIRIASITTNWGFVYLNHEMKPGYSMGYYLMPGGERIKTTLTTRVGSDELDSISFQNTVEFNAGPDEIQDVCIPVPQGPGELGAISTPFQVFGHTLVPRTSSLFAYGPQSNTRIIYPNGTAPVEQPSTWPLIPNLVPGDYRLRSQGLLDFGDQQVFFATNLNVPSRPTTVVAGQTSDAKQTFPEGERYPFVSHPAHFNGSVLLYDRYVKNHPGAPSSLSSLAFHTQWPTNNNPSYPGGTIRGPTGGTGLGSSTSSGSGSSYTSFSGRFDPAVGALASTYSLPLVSLYDQPDSWVVPSLKLMYASEAQTIIHERIVPIYHDSQYHAAWAHPEMAAPSTYRFGSMSLSQKLPSLMVWPEALYTQDHHYCFNEVRLQYVSTRGTFVNPSASVTGGFDGIDFEGSTAHYAGNGEFHGTPAVGASQPHTLFHSARTTTGQLAFALPQGTWKISPSATFVNDDGTQSNGNFPKVDLTVGCGQRIALVPGLSVSIHMGATCQAGNAATIAGTVEGGGIEINHIWYTLNGKAFDLCTSNCPRTFSFDVPLTASGAPLTVYATSPFIEGVASVSDTLPACQPPNTPPVLPPLPDLMVEAQGPAGAVVDFPLPIATDNEDGSIPATCTPAPGSLFELGQTQVVCTVSDSGGLTTQQHFTLTVRDTTPPVITTPGAVVQSACDRVVHYTVTAWDLVSQDITPVCSPPSGSVFPLGESTVTCTATDAAGNTATASFSVSVNFDSVFEGFLSPLAWQRISPKEQAAPTGIPVKFRLRCTERPAVQPRLYWAEGSGTGVGDFQPASSKGNANEDNLFRAMGDGWIFNLDVRPLGEGSRMLRVDLGDGRFHDVVILVGSSGS